MMPPRGYAHESEQPAHRNTDCDDRVSLFRRQNNEVVNYLKEPLLLAELQQCTIQEILDFALFLPGQVILFRSLDHAVAQSFSVVAAITNWIVEKNAL